MMQYSNPDMPPAQGLYDPSREHDACGVAFLATLTGVPSHRIVADALTALRNLEHRGASGSEPDSGDGAGILLQVPDAFLRSTVDFDLPAAGHYAVGIAFLPTDGDARAGVKAAGCRLKNSKPGPGMAGLA
jgi:glutamate synthase (NADPH/NADH) large chain